jgi:hypothetical protein
MTHPSSNLLRTLPMLVASLAMAAAAQQPQPTATPFPLELKRTPGSFNKKDGEELKRDFVRLTRRVSLVPDTATLEVAWRELKRQDCEREDECLQQLAQKGQTLYAVYAQVEYSLTGQVVASGRVVRDDGKLVAGPETITMVKGKGAFKDVAKAALTRLLDQLGVPGLATFRPVEPKPPSEPRPVELTPTLPPPPPPPLVVQESGLGGRAMGWTLAGVGGAAAIVGAVLAGTAKPAVDTDGNTTREALVAARTQQTVGFALVGGGAVLAAGGVAWALLSKSALQASVAPLGDGAVVVMGGRF